MDNPIIAVPPRTMADALDATADALGELARALSGLAGELRETRDLGRNLLGLPPIAAEPVGRPVAPGIVKHFIA